MNKSLIKVKLPALQRIKLYDQFYKTITRGIPKRKGMSIDVTAVYLNKENEKTLSDHLSKILKKQYKGYGETWFKTAWSMHHLSFMPCIKKSVPNGYALIDANRIYVLPGR